MNRQDNAGKAMNKEQDGRELELNDPALESALRDFRSTVHAWSEAAYSAPRAALNSAPRPVTWRRSVVWACSLTIACSLAGTGIFERQHRHALAEQAAQKLAAQQRELAARQAKDVDDLLAKVDQDLSQDIPDAMQPLTGITDDTQ